MHLHTYRPDESFKPSKRQSLIFFLSCPIYLVYNSSLCSPNIALKLSRRKSKFFFDFYLTFKLENKKKIKVILHVMATCPVVDDCAIYREIFLQVISKQEKFYKQIGTW